MPKNKRLARDLTKGTLVNGGVDWRALSDLVFSSHCLRKNLGCCVMRYIVVLNVYLFRSLKLKNLGCQELLIGQILILILLSF